MRRGGEIYFATEYTENIEGTEERFRVERWV